MPISCSEKEFLKINFAISLIAGAICPYDDDDDARSLMSACYHLLPGLSLIEVVSCIITITCVGIRWPKAV